MNKIWVVQYNDGSADVYDDVDDFEQAAPAIPYVIASQAEERIKDLEAKSQRMREALSRAIENKFEPDKWLFPAQEALKEEE